MQLERASLLRELAGTQCQCGKKKQARQTFCRACYFTLSATQRQSLYRRFGEGYEEAYADAIKTLQTKGNEEQ